MHNEPLTPEERELAQRLARLGPHGGPSPALDAKILAAAHDAVVHDQVASRQARARNARRRWPVALGVTASLALAVGIAWQLRPLPDADVAYSQAPATAEAEARQAMVPPEPAGDAVSAESGSSATAATMPIQAKPQSVVGADIVAPTAPARAAASAPHEPAPVALDDPSLGETTASLAQAPAAAPSPSAPPAPAPVFAPSPPATMADSAAGAVARPRAARGAGEQGAAERVGSNRDETKSAAPEAQAASELDRLEVTGVGAQRGDQGLVEPPLDDQPFDDQPPASADSVVVQQAWMQRIRDLIAEGKPDDARASLQEFKRRHPGVALPEDLRKFAQAPAP